MICLELFCGYIGVEISAITLWQKFLRHRYILPNLIWSEITPRIRIKQRNLDMWDIYAILAGFLGFCLLNQWSVFGYFKVHFHQSWEIIPRILRGQTETVLQTRSLFYFAYRYSCAYPVHNWVQCWIGHCDTLLLRSEPLPLRTSDSACQSQKAALDQQPLPLFTSI